MDAYCLTCRTKREIRNPQSVTLRYTRNLPGLRDEDVLNE